MGRGGKEGPGASALLYGEAPAIPRAKKAKPGPAPLHTPEHYLEKAHSFSAKEFISGCPIRLQSLVVVCSSAQLEASPTYKKFRGWVGFMPDPQDPSRRLFAAATTFGPDGSPNGQGTLEYQGEDLDQAIKAVNKKLKAKTKPSARSVYQPVPGLPGQTSLSVKDFDAGFFGRA